MPNFETWSHENLVKFAQDANAQLKQQDDRIQQLNCDLKDAVAAYRELMRKDESQPCQ